ncbi:MAG: bifunctional DNA-binding transcriptional regulator/O6-methylguanine-DNA methyltransferase Ada [Hyphomicrobium sp.]
MANSAAAAIDEARWGAIVARDRDQDDLFLYSVATTGVYCRPSCGARRPNRANVAYHATPAAAEAAGFRPCKRCRPNGASLAELHVAVVAAACSAIETAEESPTLAALAAEAGLSPHHFHRIFRSVTGLTPKDYAAAHRARCARHRLTRSRTVTEAAYDAGYNSAGRFYAASKDALGMTPSMFRKGAPETVIRFAVGACSLGTILVAASDKGVAAILLGDDAAALLDDLQARFPKARLIGGDKAFDTLVGQVIAMVERPGRRHQLPLDVRGTAFQHRVWQALRDIPAGSTATYAEIAGRLGAPKAVRAVAGACAANPLAVAIPCHRVVRTGGGLSGYRWGIERKRTLLEREKKS